MIFRCVITGFICLMAAFSIQAQCFASAGNPVGGTSNMGAMNKHIFRLAAFYRFSFSDRYFEGYKKYEGANGILKQANFNYIGWLFGYGLTKRLTIETEGGYYINKTQVYHFNNEKLKGYGLSNAVISLKPRIYHNPDKRFEISCGLGANIPFSVHFQAVDGVTLPVDLQPSTGSFGLVFQTFIIKENSFKAYRIFLVSRIEKYFENRQKYLFGTLYSTSFYFSRHFVFEKWKLKDWTLIMQLRNQYKERNKREGKTVSASGSCLFFLAPQINLSVHESWNISLIGDIPVFQYYHNIQLANSFSLALSITKDFEFKKKNK